MDCVNLVQYVQSKPSDITRTLCGLCKRINFTISFPKIPSPHWHTFEKHYHIGKFPLLVERAWCPGCRLILSATGVTDNDRSAFENAEITIYSRGLRNFSLTNDICDGVPMEARCVNPGASFIRVVLHSAEWSFQSSQMITGNIISGGCFETDSDVTSDGPYKKKIVQINSRPVSSTVDTALIKSWMNVCDNQHNACQTLGPMASVQQQIRLIDVRKFQIVQKSQEEKYVALSYVWGHGTKGILTQDALPSLSIENGLCGLEIPKTISDAIQLVKALGIEYLWVDSLCIVQDNGNDKIEQLPRMDSIYNCAYLVIMATSGNDAHAGIPGMSMPRRTIEQRKEIIDGIQYFNSQPRLETELAQSKWISRGWTFQERALARRALYLTETQVYWGCSIGTWREDVEWNISEMSLGSTFDASTLEDRTGACRTAEYCRDVMTFSERQFTDYKDRLWAFMGVLKSHACSFPKGFIWALPYEKLDTALLWSESGHCMMTHTCFSSHPLAWDSGSKSIQYPSWSYFSTTSKVSFKDPCGQGIVSEVTWKDPILLEENDLSFNGSSNTQKPSEMERNDIESSLRLETHPRESIITYGLLRFVAQTAKLQVRIKDDIEIESKKDSDAKGGRDDLVSLKNRNMPYWVSASIYNPSQECLGNMKVPSSFFDQNTQRTGEFVLLSSNTENEEDENCVRTYSGPDIGHISHRAGCKHLQSHNVLLIGQRQDPSSGRNTSYRIALGEIESDGWAKVKTSQSEITLS